MSIFSRVRDWFSREPRNEGQVSSTVALADALQAALFPPSTAGFTVTAARAMSSPLVWSAIRVLSETIAVLPLNIMRETGPRDREILFDHPVQRLLGPKGKPNEWNSAFELKEKLARDVALRGNAFAQILRVRGEPRRLLPIHPNRVKAEQDENWRISYEVRRDSAPPMMLDPRRMFHVRGPSDDGFMGDDLIAVARDAIGLTLAQDEHAARLFANGAQIKGVLEHPNKLTEEALSHLKESWSQHYEGVDKAHKTPILEEGMKFSPVAMDSEKAQLVESRALQRSIVAAIWRVPPHMVGDMEKATFSNIEHLARQFIDYAMMPWLTRFEGAVDCQILTDQERAAGLMAKFDTKGLLRGDAETRAEFASKMIAARVMNPNEAREREDLPPYEGGDEFVNPNIDTGGTDDTEPDEPESPGAMPENRRIRAVVSN